jgi:hypothetical protein
MMDNNLMTLWMYHNVCTIIESILLQHMSEEAEKL